MRGKTRRARPGFANPEYLLALTAIMITLAILIPHISRARERRRNLDALASLRGAISRYAADTKTKGPLEITQLAANGKYLAELPTVQIMGHHARARQVQEMGVTNDEGGWSYSNWPGDARQGEIWINCTHTDGGGHAWNSY